MKKLFIFIIFLIYTISIFFIDNYYILFLLLIMNLTIAALYKVNKLSIIKNMIKLLPLILVTGIINYVYVDLNFAILLTIRIILVCNTCYIYSKTISYIGFAEIIEKIFYPFKIFGVNPKDIGLMISIALSFIPIMKAEIKEIKDVLKAKGIYTSPYNLIKNTNIIFKPFFVSVLQRINEIEYTLKQKGYEG